MKTVAVHAPSIAMSMNENWEHHISVECGSMVARKDDIWNACSVCEGRCVWKHSVGSMSVNKQSRPSFFLISVCQKRSMSSLLSAGNFKKFTCESRFANLLAAGTRSHTCGTCGWASSAPVHTVHMHYTSTIHATERWTEWIWSLATHWPLVPILGLLAIKSRGVHYSPSPWYHIHCHGNCVYYPAMVTWFDFPLSIYTLAHVSAQSYNHCI